MKKIIKDIEASVNPVLLFLMTLVAVGLLYALLFTQVFVPLIAPLIPASDSKVYFMMIIYAIPMIVVVVGMISVFQKALKKSADRGF